MLLARKDDTESTRKVRRNVIYRWRRILVAVCAAILFIISILAFWLWLTIPIDKSAEPLVPARIVLLTREGQPFAVAGPLMDTPVRVQELPPYVAQAFYAIEDRRFQHHFGVDPIGIARALANNLSGGDRQGGSTITQQLAKNVYLIDPETGAPYPGYSRKLHEIAIAIWLEVWLSKDQILERYLSNVAFGKNIYGLRAASLHYFYRQPENLTLPQAIMLAGLVQAPSRYDPTSNETRARARALRVGHAMQDAGYLPDGDGNLPQIAELDVRVEPPVRTHFYFSDWVVDEARARAGQGYAEKRIVTTLDRQLQIAAQDVVRDIPANGADVALVAMRPDGEVVAMIGGRDYSRSQFNIAVSGRRQPGSTFKLFTYFTALQRGMAPDSTISNAPITQGEYRPANADGEYGNDISLSDAFAISSNVAATRLFEQIGADAVVDTARALGVTGRVDMNPSLALGTSDVSLLRMTAAYAAIAAGRARIEPVGLPRLAKPADAGIALDSGSEPLDPRAVRDMRLMLAKVITHGTGRAAQLPVQAYGKTGTTQNNRDAWFIGYAGELVVGVWLGNDTGAAIEGLSGGDGAARLWRAFMLRAIAADRLTRPAKGAGRFRAGKGTAGRPGATAAPSSGGVVGVTIAPEGTNPSVNGKLRGDDGQQVDLLQRDPVLRGVGVPSKSRANQVGSARERGAGVPATPSFTQERIAPLSPGSREAVPGRTRAQPPRRGTRATVRPVTPVREPPRRERRDTGAEDEDFTIECGDDSC